MVSDIDKKDIKEERFDCHLKLLSKLENVHEHLLAQDDDVIKVVRAQECISKCENIVNVLRTRKVIMAKEYVIQLVPECTPLCSNLAAVAVVGRFLWRQQLLWQRMFI